MKNTLSIQIPCTYENETLVISALNLKGNALTPQLALIEAIKNTVYFTDLKKANVINFKDHRGRDFIFLEVPFTNLVYETIVDLEPMPSVAAKSTHLKSFLIEPTTEELLTYGYPDENT